MSTESEMNQNVIDITTKRKPLTQEERDYFISLMHGPDETCRELNDYGHRLLGHPIHIVCIDNHYRVIGVYNEIFEFRSRWWDLGDTPVHAKKYLYREYLHRLYHEKAVPTDYMNLLWEAINAHMKWESAIIDLAIKLNVDIDDRIKFRDDIEIDCYQDGGLNCDGIVDGYWVRKMVEQKLRKFDPDRSPELILEEFKPKPKPKREPKIKPVAKLKAKPERKPKVKPESPPQEYINFEGWVEI
jgi:hypothetical protein